MPIVGAPKKGLACFFVFQLVVSIGFLAWLFLIEPSSAENPPKQQRYSPTTLAGRKNKQAPSVPAKPSDALLPLNRSSIIEVKNNHDFGAVPVNREVVHVFKLRNMSNNQVLIRNVLPSCGCTVTDFPDKDVLLKKDETYDLQAKLSAGSLPGARKSSILILFHPPTTLPLTLTLSANVIGSGVQ